MKPVYSSKNPWKTISSKVAYKNPWYQVREDMVIRPDGKPGKYCFVENKGGVFIIALTEKREVYLVKLFRYPTKQWSWELPGGSKDNPNSLISAKKELMEEAGLKASRWLKIGTFQSFNGLANEISHTFLATGLKSLPYNMREEEGIFEVKKVPLKKALKMIQTGELSDGQSITALFQVILRLGLF